MCTLTYRLTAQGYELYFNRDEQRSRPQAIQPTVNTSLNAIYPIDPTGGGTWIAAQESGVTLALLNYYQAHKSPDSKNFTSRGVIIPHLLANIDSIHDQLTNMDLTVFQAFQLCVFDGDLSIGKEELATQYVWDGKGLTISSLSTSKSLPITSSGVDFEIVSEYRQQQFKKMITNVKATKNEYIAYHEHQGELGKCSVKMYREDAKTVSFTQITVDQFQPLGKKVNLEYTDHFTASPEITSFTI